MKALVNGVELSYEVQGEGQPLLFIHGGYGGPSSTLAPQRPPILDILPTESVRTVVYDRRNCGKSAYVRADYTLEDLARDACSLLDHLGIESVITVGSSAGGPIALQLALAFPKRVRALCLANTGANLMSEERAVGRRRKALVEQQRQEGDQAVFDSRKDEVRNPPEATVGNVSAEVTRQRRRALLDALASASDEELCLYSSGEVRNFAAYVGFDYTPRLAELRMPVCVIHGTADMTVPFAWGRALHDFMPGSEFHAIDGAGHGILAYPAAAAALRSWVLRLISAASPETSALA